MLGVGQRMKASKRNKDLGAKGLESQYGSCKLLFQFLRCQFSHSPSPSCHLGLLPAPHVSLLLRILNEQSAFASQSFLKKIVFICTVFCLCICLGTICLPAVWGLEEEVGALELESKLVLSHLGT